MRVEHRSLVDVVMLQRNQFALRRRPKADTLLCTSTMTYAVEHHLAAEHQSHGPADLSRRRGGERAMRPREQLVTETRSHEFGDDPDVLVRQTEHLCQDTSQVHDSLR